MDRETLRVHCLLGESAVEDDFKSSHYEQDERAGEGAACIVSWRRVRGR